MKLKGIQNLDLTGKKVLLRLDLNLPIKGGVVQDKTRLTAALPTVDLLRKKGAIVLILTHYGRPGGAFHPEFKVDLIAEALSEALGTEVLKLDDCIGELVEEKTSSLEPGSVVLLENTRFHPGEKKNDPLFSKELAKNADLYVNDAFGAAHRAHASTEGVTHYLESYAGLLMQKEVEVLSKLLSEAESPFCLIAGGAKIDTKIGILNQFLGKADDFLIGGALANTFVAAQGHPVGKSLYQEDKLNVAQAFAESCPEQSLHLPDDFACASEISEEAHALNFGSDEIPDDQIMLDIGPDSQEAFVDVIRQAKTIIWNGPMGFYEIDAFSEGTRAVAEAVAKSEALSVLGGGDTIDAIAKMGLSVDQFSHISTGGGAMLEFLEGKTLPALTPLLA